MIVTSIFLPVGEELWQTGVAEKQVTQRGERKANGCAKHPSIYLPTSSLGTSTPNPKTPQSAGTSSSTSETILFQIRIKNKK